MAETSRLGNGLDLGCTSRDRDAIGLALGWTIQLDRDGLALISAPIGPADGEPMGAGAGAPIGPAVGGIASGFPFVPAGTPRSVSSMGDTSANVAAEPARRPPIQCRVSTSTPAISAVLIALPGHHPASAET